MNLRLNLTEEQACIVANALRPAIRDASDAACTAYAHGNTAAGAARQHEALEAGDVLRRITNYIIALDERAREERDDVWEKRQETAERVYRAQVLAE